MREAVLDAAELDRRILAREAEIIGKPPRIAAPAPTELDADLALATYEKIRRNSSGNAAKATWAEIPEMVLTVLRHPELFRCISDVSGELQARGDLNPRDRQLAILRTTWLCQAPYPFGEHVINARRVGFTSEEIERVVIGSDAPEWSAHERAVIRAAEELHRDAMISDATWSVLAGGLSKRQLFELTVLVGQFTLVSYFQNSLRLRLRPENPGLRAR